MHQGNKKINWTPEILQIAKEVYNDFYAGIYKHTYSAEKAFYEKTGYFTSWLTIRYKIEGKR